MVGFTGGHRELVGGRAMFYGLVKLFSALFGLSGMNSARF